MKSTVFTLFKLMTTLIRSRVSMEIEIVHFNITEHPTAQWTAQQITEEFSWDTTPKYLLRDRDGIYGSDFQRRVASMGIEEVVTTPRSPWQNAYVERIIGRIRRDCLDHIVVLNEPHLKRIPASYCTYYITGVRICPLR